MIPNLELYLRSKLPHDLHHILDLIRDEACPVDDNEIVEQLTDLYQRHRVTFAYEGDWIIGSPSKWSDDEWKSAQINGTVFNSILRSNYRARIKKREIERVRIIMRTLSHRIPIHPEWGFVRYHLYAEAAKKKEDQECHHST